jgi:hypothetical protein
MVKLIHKEPGYKRHSLANITEKIKGTTAAKSFLSLHYILNVLSKSFHTNISHLLRTKLFSLETEKDRTKAGNNADAATQA